MMEITFICQECGSAIEVYPRVEDRKIKCKICSHEQEVQFTKEHEEGILKVCPCCSRKDFYTQKDFSRFFGVLLFVIAAVASIWTYGLSFVVLYLFDFLLFKKLALVAVCYKCNTLFRKIKNMAEIPGYNHEMNDRIVYSDHDFDGRPLEH